jgi:hypothetical protein
MAATQERQQRDQQPSPEQYDLVGEVEGLQLYDEALRD